MIQNSFKQIFKRTWLLVLALLVGFVLVGCEPEDLEIDLSLANTTYTVVEGDTINVAPEVDKGVDVGDITLIYSSEDTAVATFVNGVVTGVAPGTTKIKVEVDGRPEVFVEATVTVTAYVEPEFTVTYVLDGGSNPSSNPAKYKASDDAITLANATRLGYSFRGWFANAEFTGEPVTEIAADATGNLTFYAKWLKITDYTITYHLDGGTNNEANPDGFRNTLAPIALEDPTKEGYTFLGWFDNEELEGDAWTEIAFGVEEDVELWASWEAVEKTITYNLDGGTNNEANPATFIIDDLPLELAVPTKAGFVFKGWFLDAELTEPAILQIEELEDVEVFASWEASATFNIAYVLNGGENAAANPATYDNEFVTALAEPTRVGYTFEGWFFEEDFSGLEVTELAIGMTGDVTLYAKWAAVEYEITLNMDGGTEVTLYEDRDAVVADFLADYNAWGSTSYTLADLPMGAWGGINYHTFLMVEQYKEKWGWLINYLSETALPEAAGLIRGFWTVNTPAEFEAKGDSEFIFTWEFRAFLQGIQYTPSQWWPTPDYSEEEFGNGFWHYLTFAPVYTIEDTVGLPTLQKEGYIFMGWFDNAEFTGEAVAQVPAGSTGDKEFFAKWLLVATFDVVYNLDGGVNNAENPAEFTNDDHTPLLAPTKEGYHFLGWFTNAEFTGNAITRIDRYQTADFNVYAKWMLIETFDITYVLNEGVAAENAPATFANNVVTALPAPTRVGYTFAGWFLDAEFTGTAITSIAFGTQADVTVYAKWNVANYAINYTLNGGYWKYPTKADMIVDFLTDFHEFLDSTEDLNTFIHGVDKTSGFAGTWEAQKAKIYSGLRPEAANPETTVFIDHPDYFDKWISFFDFFDALVKELNPAQYFFGASTYVGLLRLPAYFKGATFTAAQLAKVPDYSGAPRTYTMFDEPIAISVVPNHTNQYMVFQGWFFDAEFTGEAVTQIATGSYGNKTLFAKWEEVDNFEKVIDAIDALPGVEALTYEDKAAVEAARELFDALSETAQALVTNEDVLISAEAQMVILGEMQITSELPDFYQGVPAMFSIGTEARDFEGTMVIARFTLPEGVTVEYQEGGEGDWIALVDVFGPASGFPLGDITSHFRGTFLAEGTYNITVSFEQVSDSTVLATEEFEIVVEDADFALTLDANGGEIATPIVYETLDDLKVDFLTDLYTFLELTIPVSDFIHGVGNTSGFAGLWYSNETYKTSIYAINSREINPESTKFINQPEYNVKWLPFMDMVDDLVTEINPAQTLWGSTYTGFMRLDSYFRGVSPFLPAHFERRPDMFEFAQTKELVRNANSEFVLPVLEREGFLFGGWFVGEDFNVLPFETIEAFTIGDFAFTARWIAEEDIVDIATARTTAADEKVITKGVVTSRIGSAAFIQDGTAGIYLYFGGNAKYDELYAVGNEVVVRGEGAVFNDLVQLDNFDMVLTLNTEVALPAAIEVTDLATFDFMAVQGELVTVEGLTIKTIPNIGTGAYTVVATDGTNDLQIRVDQYIANYAEVKALFQMLEVGQSIDIINTPASRFRANAQLMLSDVDQVVFYPLTQTEVEDILTTALAPAETAMVDMELPLTTTVGGVEYPIVWTSNNAAISETGVVTRGETDVVVTLTATVEYDELNDIVITFDVTVLASDAPSVFTVTAAYPSGAGTTNMSADNNAAALGLNADLFTVTSTERVVSPLHVGLNNAGQIRLYGSSDTAGNILTIAIAEGFEITDIEFVFGSTVGLALIEAGEVELFNGALTANSTVPFTDLTASSFSIQNINAGTAQIYILSIAITYGAVAVE